MSKDHVPSDFSRESGYKSDLEIAETGPMVKSINTSFGSKNHNAYIHRTDGTHEHFYYSPQEGKSGWHGYNWETRNNHPNLQEETQSISEGGKTMDRNSFIESIKVDKATVDRCNEVCLNAAKNANTHSSKQTMAADDGGRERGDTGPGALGREAGNKGGSFIANGGTDGGHSSSGHAAGNSGNGGQGSSDGESSGSDHNSGGQDGHDTGGHGGH